MDGFGLDQKQLCDHVLFRRSSVCCCFTLNLITTHCRLSHHDCFCGLCSFSVNKQVITSELKLVTGEEYHCTTTDSFITQIYQYHSSIWLESISKELAVRDHNLACRGAECDVTYRPLRVQQDVSELQHQSVRRLVVRLLQRVGQQLRTRGLDDHLTSST